MGRKKILLKDFGKFRDVFVKTQPSVVDLVMSWRLCQQACE